MRAGPLVNRAQSLSTSRWLVIRFVSLVVGGPLVFLLTWRLGETPAHAARFAIVWSLLMLVLAVVARAIQQRRRPS